MWYRRKNIKITSTYNRYFQIGIVKFSRFSIFNILFSREKSVKVVKGERNGKLILFYRSYFPIRFPVFRINKII